MSAWTLLCDFDGTVTLEDVTDTLLERYGRPGWEALEADWRAGRIGSRECMAGQIGLIEASPAELDAHCSEMHIDPAFPAFVAAARAAGHRVEIVSDGLDATIARILARHRLDDLPVTANRLRAVEAKRWALDFPHGRPDCASGHCKCATAATRGRVLLIGDGASDFCVAGAADYVFAKKKLIDHCRSRGIRHAPIAGFADALALLPRLDELAAVPAYALKD